MAEHPEEAANFDAAMSTFTAPIAEVVATAYDFSGVRHVVDVGGGNGALLAGILKAHPRLKGTLFDLPEVVGGHASDCMSSVSPTAATRSLVISSRRCRRAPTCML